MSEKKEEKVTDLLKRQGKRKRKSEPVIYHLVSLTSVCSNVEEKILKGKNLKHLGENGSMTNKQHGFIRNGKKAHRSIFSSYNCKVVTEGNTVGVIYLPTNI